MSALLRQRLLRTKIDEKLHVFWDIDFGGVLGGFWAAQILDFRTFFDDFSKQILQSVLEGPKKDEKV